MTKSKINVAVARLRLHKGPSGDFTVFECLVSLNHSVVCSSTFRLEAIGSRRGVKFRTEDSCAAIRRQRQRRLHNCGVSGSYDYQVKILSKFALRNFLEIVTSICTSTISNNIIWKFWCGLFLLGVPERLVRCWKKVKTPRFSQKS